MVGYFVRKYKYIYACVFPRSGSFQVPSPTTTYLIQLSYPSVWGKGDTKNIQKKKVNTILLSEREGWGKGGLGWTFTPYIEDLYIRKKREKKNLDSDIIILHRSDSLLFYLFILD